MWLVSMWQRPYDRILLMEAYPPKKGLGSKLLHPRGQDGISYNHGNHGYSSICTCAKKMAQFHTVPVYQPLPPVPRETVRSWRKVARSCCQTQMVGHLIATQVSVEDGPIFQVWRVSNFTTIPRNNIRLNVLCFAQQRCIIWSPTSSHPSTWYAHLS